MTESGGKVKRDLVRADEQEKYEFKELVSGYRQTTSISLHVPPL